MNIENPSPIHGPMRVVPGVVHPDDFAALQSRVDELERRISIDNKPPTRRTFFRVLKKNAVRDVVKACCGFRDGTRSALDVQAAAYTLAEIMDKYKAAEE